MPGSQLAPSLETRRVVSADGTSIAYRVSAAPSSDAPWLVLASPLGGCGPLAACLAGRYRLLGWDHRGLFASDKPRERSLAAYGVDRHVEDLRAVLEREGIRRASLVAFGLGVPVMLEALAAMPGLATSLVLLCGVAGPLVDASGPARATRAWRPRLLELAQRESARVGRLARRFSRWRSAPAWLLRLGLVSEALGEARAREIVEGVGGVDMDALLWNVRALGTHDARRVLPRVGAPALVVCGGRDHIAPRALGHQLARDLARSEVLVVPGGTHATPVEYPELVALRMVRFYEEAAAGEGRRVTATT